MMKMMVQGHYHDDVDDEGKKSKSVRVVLLFSFTLFVCLCMKIK